MSGLPDLRVLAEWDWLVCARSWRTLHCPAADYQMPADDPADLDCEAFAMQSECGRLLREQGVGS
jgi:hypothetical protein